MTLIRGISTLTTVVHLGTVKAVPFSKKKSVSVATVTRDVYSAQVNWLFIALSVVIKNFLLTASACIALSSKAT